MQRSRAFQARAELHKVLRAAQGPDGGWPYYSGRASRLEPTSWALLALAGLNSKDDEVRIDSARAFLRRLGQDQRLLVEAGMPSANVGWNGLALLADMSVVGSQRDAWQSRVAEGILATRGIAIDEPSSPVRQNNRLQAWAWTEGTFSWIEPTALCLLALKKMSLSSALARTRIADGEAVILDRVCDGGGWNYGNAQVLGQDLRPYVPTTALVLLAMRDRREPPAITASLAWLETHAGSERSAMALALSVICLTSFDEPADALRDLLVAQQARTAFLGNLHLTAMAICALNGEPRALQPFQVA